MASPIRMSGMVSGLDTESIVKALTSSYQTKVDDYKKAQTKLSWKQDAWKEVNTKINDFYNSLDNYRYQSSWNLQKATASDATKATVTANGTAFNGTQTLKITSLASAASLTSGKLGDDKSKVTASTKLSDIAGADAVGKTIRITVGDKNTDLEIDADTTVQSLVNKLKDAGLNASFDEDQQSPVHRSGVPSGNIRCSPGRTPDKNGTVILTQLSDFCAINFVYSPYYEKDSISYPCSILSAGKRNTMQSAESGTDERQSGIRGTLRRSGSRSV